jgi:putative transposase
LKSETTAFVLRFTNNTRVFGTISPAKTTCSASPNWRGNGGAQHSTEVGGSERGYDGGKKIKGRKRHLLVDTLGLLIAVLITGAGLDDGVAAPRLLAHVTPTDFPRLVVIFADQKYHNHVFEAWLAEHRAGWHLDVKMRPEGTKGFTPLAKRWVVERTNAWHGRHRRNSKDYERTVESITAMIQISNIHLMLNKLVPCSRPAFHYRTEAA